MVTELKKFAEDGELGDPVALHADLSGDFDLDSMYQCWLELTSVISKYLGIRYSVNSSYLGSKTWRWWAS